MAKTQNTDFLLPLSAPARRAVLGAGIDSLAKLRKVKQSDLLQLHGFGPSSIPVINRILNPAGQGLNNVAGLKKKPPSKTGTTGKETRKVAASKAGTSSKVVTALRPVTTGGAGKDTAAVQAYIDKLDKNLQQHVQELRRIILDASKLVSEHIKWNSPAFYYDGPMQHFDPKEYKRDLIVMNLHRGRLMLVFPTGAKLDDSHHLLEGDYKDGRRVISFDDPAKIGKSKSGLTALIQRWISLVV